jgi:phosphate/sulfate permease
MNGFYIFVIRLILGGALGTLITRIFRPEWNLFYGGVGIGIGLVAAAYIMEAVGRKKKQQNR